MIQAGDVYHVWLQLLRTLIHHPQQVVAPRGQATRECLAQQLIINDLRKCLIYHPVRNINYKFAVAEWLWILLELDDVNALLRYNKQMSRFSDDGKVLAGAYGPRLGPQWSYVVDTLRRDPNSRQAVSVIFTPYPPPSKDVPCTISLQFLLREAFQKRWLHVITTMRSSDAWLGIPYDAFTFAQLANLLANELNKGDRPLNVELGSLTFNLGSSHLYESDLEAAKRVIEAPSDGAAIASPNLTRGFPSADERRGLEHALYGREHGMELYWPWCHYANVLKADTFTVARGILSGMTDE
ncbi:MAG TPA: thymidylate synthase [Chloroflexota bacterium]|nr:thymidylate synthase [Chloroflexota bacterium]